MHQRTIINDFASIGLAEMSGVELLERTDTKYLFTEDRLDDVLRSLLPHYRMLTIDGARGTDYHSLYFDTDDLRSYREHHNGRTFRSKVRFREYAGSGLCFLEVKRSNGRGGTSKIRMRAAAITQALDGEQQRFVNSIRPPQGGPLRPVLWNHYHRITLVANDRPERLTIDRALRFNDDDGEGSLGALCIAELKQSRGDRGSRFTSVMRALGIRPGGLSKYCVGLTMLDPLLKHNRFNPALRAVDRLLNTT